MRPRFVARRVLLSWIRGDSVLLRRRVGAIGCRALLRGIAVLAVARDLLAEQDDEDCEQGCYDEERCVHVVLR
jgi:hypothetical protein